MNIALVASEFVTEHSFAGGLSNYLYRTACMLQQLGHTVTVITAAGCTETLDYHGIPVRRVAIKDQTGWKIPWYFLKLDALTRLKFNMAIHTLWQSYMLNREVRRVHREKALDVVHYAHLEAVGILRPRSIPAVIRLSSSTRLCHECGGYGSTDAYIRQQEQLEHRALKRADAIFGPSKFIAEHVSKDIGRPIDVIESPFTMDTDHLDDSVYTEHLQNKKYLLFYGSIGHIKGVGTIAKIIHTLLSQHRDLQFVFVGKQLNGQKGGPLLEQVRTNAKEHSDRIMHFHPLRHNQLYPIVQHAHTVVLPSLIDNFPNTCIESMAHNRVVIGTRGNGFEQLIDHGKSGLLCAVDDPEDLLQNINMALLMTEKEREAMGAHAAARIETLHPDIIGPKLLALYEKAIATL